MSGEPAVTASAGPRVDRTERLLNLVLSLLGARQPVSRAQIAASVPGYSASSSPAAFERMFERDKDELRGMGIPVETVVDGGGEVLGYRIPSDEYALPPIEVDAEEASVLTLAASVWDEAALRESARTAVRKLEASAGVSAPGPEAVERVLVRHGAADAADAAILPSLEGLREGRRLAFGYRDARGQDSHRRVDPWSVVAREGRWYIVGHDVERGAVRAFRADRVTGTVTVTGERVETPAPEDVDVAALVIAGSDAPGVRAMVTALPFAGAQLRRAAVGGPAPAGETSFEVEEATLDRLVAVACASAPEAVITGPADVRAAVIARLAAVLDAHDEAGGSTGPSHGDAS